MKSLIVANEANNRINVNHLLSSYFVSNSNDNIIKVSIKLLSISVKDVIF